MLRTLTRSAWLALVVLGIAAPASAQVVHSLQLGIGGFMPRGEDSRVENDVLLKNQDALVFKVKDLSKVDVRGEWNISFGHHVETGVGLGYYRGSVPTNYRDFTHPNGSEIEQELTLRIIPISAVVRFMPFGKIGTFQPYVGAGVSFLWWRYTENGEFVEANFDTFRGRFTDTGNAVGPVLLGGAKIPVGGDIYGITLEARYQYGQGTLDPSLTFAGKKIDLGGLSAQVGFLIRF